MIIENSILTQKTARYYTIGEPSDNTETIWLVIHGYGQLAKEFISEFECISNESTIIVAPEGLSRFYFRGFSGTIGASWMTKEDRENDIKDYINFIDTSLQKVISEINNEKIRLNIIGFSQGCHTAIRWLDRTKTHVNSLTLFGGSFPEDVSFSDFKEYWSSIRTTIFLGDKDKMVDREKLNYQISKLNILNYHPNLIPFEGGHQINKKMLLNLEKQNI